MAILRIYDSGDGDCIAIRERRSTSFIFDTGLRSKYRRCSTERNSKGFGLALFHAVGAPQTKGSRSRRKISPPVVVISHIDNDHIGGLLEWTEDIIKHSDTQSDARKRARKEIREVWCC